MAAGVTTAFAVAATVLTSANFTPSEFPWGTDFFGTAPLPDRAGESYARTAASAVAAERSPFNLFVPQDPWLVNTFANTWLPSSGATTTIPWMTGFSTPRLLGGLAQKDSAGHYHPDYSFELVTRLANGSLSYNWSRLDATLDGFLLHAKVKDYMIVLDNVPYAFVRPENRYFCTYGNGAAPDDPEEFASFIGDMASHMVARYGINTVSRWRFRLGTECDGPRMGPRWQNFTAPNPPFTMPGENGTTFTTRVNGLKIYVETYLAVAKALERVIPGVRFGPSNMAGVGSHAGCTACPYLERFADQVRRAGAPLDFMPASQYSQWDHLGLAPVALMGQTPAYLRRIASRTGHPNASIEAHEWGWAGWGKWNQNLGSVRWPSGAWGAAWDLGSFLYQRRGGASRVFHWQYQTDNSLANRNASATCPHDDDAAGTEAAAGSCRPRGYPLVTGHGWLLTALLHMQPRDVDTSVALSEFVTDIASEAGYGSTLGGIRAVGQDAIAFLIMHFSPNITDRFTRWIKLSLSPADVAQLTSGAGCKSLRVEQQALNRTTCTHDSIANELHATGQKVAAEAQAVDVVSNMATPAGLRQLATETAAWMAHNRQMMSFVDYEGALEPMPASDGRSGGGCTLTFDLETPSVLLLRITKSRLSK